MVGENATMDYKKGIRYASGPIAADNKQNTGLAKRQGFRNSRAHVILELEIKKEI